METPYILAALDFTSAPSKAKPLVLIEGSLTRSPNRSIVHLNQLHRFTTWEAWAQWLDSTEAFLGIDAPLGLPEVFMHHHHLNTYAACVAWLCQQTKADWLNAVNTYAESHPPGQKQPKRITDIQAKALSPLMAVRVPVARMAYEAITRLHHHGWVTIPQQSQFLEQPAASQQHVTELYPAVLARQLTQHRYKQESGVDEAQTRHRDHLVAQLPQWLANYGIECVIPSAMHQAALADVKGDVVDALLGIGLLAWCFKHPEKAFPDTTHPDFQQIQREGWIPNPISE